MTTRRLLPLALILVLMLTTYISGLHHYLSFESLRHHRSQLIDAVETYPVAAPLIFITVYTILTALSVPGGSFLSLCGGFLFPQPYSTLYVVVGATSGALILFEVARTALGDILKRKAGTLMEKIEGGIREDGWSYLLFLRLVPLFPFWLVNLAPAFFGVRTLTFAWTTFVGIIPGAFVFTQAGAGLGAIFDSGESLNLATVFNPQVKLALLALGIFALMPLLLKKLRKVLLHK